MILLLISCCSFMFSHLFWGKSLSFVCYWLKKIKVVVSMKNLPVVSEMEDEICLLDLPELVLDSIFERLSATGLFSMAGVCRFLRKRCCGDHLWEKHMKLKWGRLIGDATYREWQCHIASKNRSKLEVRSEHNGLSLFLSRVWPFSLIRSTIGSDSKPKSFLPVDSIMALYLSLEHGKFWFPAQVYNRENGHVGFMLSCYDAQVCYDFQTDRFQARYSPYGQRTVEENIQWERLRAPPVDTPPHVLHPSDCLHDLKPSDHIEIQWRRSKEFSNGWWYGVVGHLDSCNGNANNCHCNQNDIVILEFNQYKPGSRWRRTSVNRKDHKEEGNQVDGFYGGIRKLYNQEDISMRIRLWPTKVLQ